MLGVRVGTDISQSVTGMVHPGTGGMSVAPDNPKLLPRHLRPFSLGGEGRYPVFSMASTRLGENLQFRRDDRRSERHGYVEPAKVMQIAVYQHALAQTVSVWQEWK